VALPKPPGERHLQVTNTVENAELVVQAGVIHGDVNVHTDAAVQVVKFPYRAGTGTRSARTGVAPDRVR